MASIGTLSCKVRADLRPMIAELRAAADALEKLQRENDERDGAISESEDPNEESE